MSTFSVRQRYMISLYIIKWNDCLLIGNIDKYESSFKYRVIVFNHWKKGCIGMINVSFCVYIISIFFNISKSSDGLQELLVISYTYTNPLNDDIDWRDQPVLYVTLSFNTFWQYYVHFCHCWSFHFSHRFNFGIIAFLSILLVGNYKLVLLQ